MVHGALAATLRGKHLGGKIVWELGVKGSDGS